LKPIAFALLVLLAAPAWGLEYRSTARAAILYDAPSSASNRLAVVGSKVPLEVIADSGDWVKVRDANGHLSWIETSALGTGRSVMVKVEECIVRQQPEPDAVPVFRASRGVLLDAVGEPTTLGWLQVRHIDGPSGWLRIHEVWGQ
jgi:SH3-like domain-containing protein